jgi:hypothetical protein
MTMHDNVVMTMSFSCFFLPRCLQTSRTNPYAPRESLPATRPHRTRLEQGLEQDPRTNSTH